MATRRTLPVLAALLLAAASFNATAKVEHATLWLLTWQQVVNGGSQRLTVYTRDEAPANQIEAAQPDPGGPNGPRLGMGHCTSPLPNTVLVDRLVTQSDPAVRANCYVSMQATPVFDTPIYRWQQQLPSGQPSLSAPVYFTGDPKFFLNSQDAKEVGWVRAPAPVFFTANPNRPGFEKALAQSASLRTPAPSNKRPLRNEIPRRLSPDSR